MEGFNPATIIFGPIIAYLLIFWLKEYFGIFKWENYKLNTNTAPTLLFGVGSFVIGKLAWELGLAVDNAFIQLLCSVVVGVCGIGVLGIVLSTISGQGWNSDD